MKGGGTAGEGVGEEGGSCMFETLLYGNAKSCLRDGNVCMCERKGEGGGGKWGEMVGLLHLFVWKKGKRGGVGI